MQTKKLHFGPLKNSKPFLTIHQTMHAADIDFYRGYDPQFLAKKATILYGIYTNLSAFKECSQSWGVRFDSTDADISNVLATELHNASFHQTEAMIAFLLCEFENRPDWVYLTSYGNTEMKNAAKAILEKDFGSLTNGLVKTEVEFVKSAVFANLDLSSGTTSEAWEQSVQDIAWLLEHVAERFIAGHEYNAYKHGLRVVSGPAGLNTWSETAPNSVRSLISMDHAISYLEISEDTAGYIGSKVCKEVSPEYSFELILGMAGILALTQQMRVARIESSLGEVMVPEYDRNLLLSKQPGSKFSVPY
jgi:hypothetical protein